MYVEGISTEFSFLVKQ